MNFEEKLALLGNQRFIDLGYDHYLQPDYIGEEIAGYIIYHKCPIDGGLSCGYINITPGATNRDGRPRPLWTVVKDEPLTLVPSVLSPADGDHGWIQQGRWVKA